MCFGGLLLLGGRLADGLGRRRAFLLGLTWWLRTYPASALSGKHATFRFSANAPVRDKMVDPSTGIGHGGDGSIDTRMTILLDRASIE